MYTQIIILNFFIILNFCDNNFPLKIMIDEKKHRIFKISKLYLNKFEIMLFKRQFKKGNFIVPEFDNPQT